jgi:hypothetical protein
MGPDRGARASQGLTEPRTKKAKKIEKRKTIYICDPRGSKPKTPL